LVEKIETQRKYRSRSPTGSPTEEVRDYIEANITSTIMWSGQQVKERISMQGALNKARIAEVIDRQKKLYK
jgi:hypothetical protein